MDNILSCTNYVWFLCLTAKITQIEYGKILHHDCFLELRELRLVPIAANYA